MALDLSTAGKLREFLDKMKLSSDATENMLNLFGATVLHLEQYEQAREAEFKKLKDAVVGIALNMKEMQKAFEEVPAPEAPQVEAAPAPSDRPPPVPENELPFKVKADVTAPPQVQTPGGGPIPVEAAGGAVQNTSRVTKVEPIAPMPKNGNVMPNPKGAA